MRRAPAALLCVSLAGCGGGAIAPPKTYTSVQTALIESTFNACTITFTVHDDGTAQRTSQNCSGTSNASVTVAAAAVSKFFSDLQAAQPLSSLPRALTVDTALSISWNGQSTPNISPAANATEQTLLDDVSAITQAFPSR